MFREVTLLLATVLFTGTCIPAAAVCFKDGVSVDPSSVGPVVSWEVEFQQAALVVVGTVLSEQRIPDPKEPDFWAGTLYRLKVESVLKGRSRKSLDVFTPNDSSRLPLTKGRRYLLFLNEQDGRLIADPCGNSARLVYPF